MRTYLLTCFLILSGSLMAQQAKVLSTSLMRELDKVIDYTDSLYESSDIHSLHRSYWIMFHVEDSTCTVNIMADFNFYDSERMTGFFKHRDKYISIYIDEESCAQGLVSTGQLFKGKITRLKDYSDDSLDENGLPKVAIYPHDPTTWSYAILDSGDLKLFWSGMR